MALTYQGRVVIPFPAHAAKHVDYTLNSISEAATSPFTGSQQVQVWSPGFSEIDIQYPPMTAAQAIAFKQFYVAAQGMACVFALPAWMTAGGFVPVGLAPSGYWCLSKNQNKFSVDIGMINGFQFVIREIIAYA